MALCLTAFLGFHLYLIYAGMTTNEYYKWNALLLLLKNRSRVAQQWQHPPRTPSDAATRFCAVPGGDTTNAARATEGDGCDDSGEPGGPSYHSTRIPQLLLPVHCSNVYNLGPVSNAKEVFFPRSLRKKRSSWRKGQ
jgi:hypothetical protein